MNFINMKNKKVVILIVSFLALFGLFIYLISTVIQIDEEETVLEQEEYKEETENQEEEVPQIEEEEYSIDKVEITQLNNFGRYFTVSKVITMLYGYVSSNDEVALFNQLSDLYIEYEGISINNIDEYIESSDTMYMPSIMGVKTASIYDQVEIYFIKVLLIQDELNADYLLLDQKYEYLAVFFDSLTYSYSFMPISEYEYENEEFYEEDLLCVEEVESNDYNNYTVVSASNQMIAQMLFSNMLTAYLYQIEGYEDFFEDYTDYFSNGNIVIDAYTSLTSYTYSYSNSTLLAIDNRGYTYYFKINSVLDYKVSINP